MFDFLFFDWVNCFDINLYFLWVVVIVIVDNCYEVMKFVKKYIVNNDLYVMFSDGVVILKFIEIGSVSSYVE